MLLEDQVAQLKAQIGSGGQRQTPQNGGTPKSILKQPGSAKNSQAP